MASPPEVHATLLTSGPGPGPLLAAAGAWSSLSVAYTTAAQDLTALLASVAAGLWRGVAGEQYQAAHLPYLSWLYRAGVDSARMATAHEQTAAAYTAALAAMPTLPELAANHTTHGVLVATNFFGINTIPIALNEADYVRMWVQAATTMATYEAVSDTLAAATPGVSATVPIQKSAAASSPPSSENPVRGLLDFLDPILKALGIQDGVTAHDPMISNALTTAVSHFLQNFGINWNPAAGTLNGQVYDYYSNAAQPIWYLARSLELFEDFLNITQDPSQIIPALQYLAALALFDWPTHIAQLATTISQSPALFVAAAGAVVAPAGALGGLAGLAGLGPAPGVLAAPAPPVVVADVPGAAVGSPVMAPPTSPPAGPPASAPAGAGPPALPPAPPAAVPASAPLMPYLIGGGPGIDTGSGLGAHVGAPAAAKKKAPTPAAASAEAAAAARRSTRLRRRKARPGHDDAVMDLTVGVCPDWGPAPASDHGAGELGRARAARTDQGLPTGLTRLAAAESADGPRMPLLPETWNAG